MAQPPPAAPLLFISDVNLDDFKGLTKLDINEARLEQTEIRDAARKKLLIFNSLLADSSGTVRQERGDGG